MAGPVEATALGNVLVQARALGACTGGLPDLRNLLRRHLVPERYAPQGNGAAWDALDARTPRS